MMGAGGGGVDRKRRWCSRLWEQQRQRCRGWKGLTTRHAQEGRQDASRDPGESSVGTREGCGEFPVVLSLAGVWILHEEQIYFRPSECWLLLCFLLFSITQGP